MATNSLRVPADLFPHVLKVQRWLQERLFEMPFTGHRGTSRLAIQDFTTFLRTIGAPFTEIIEGCYRNGWLYEDEVELEGEENYALVPMIGDSVKDAKLVPDGDVNEVASQTTTGEDAYVPVSFLIGGERFNTLSKVKTYLKNNPDVRTCKPHPNRLSVHAGDWHRSLKTKESDGFAMVDEIEAAKDRASRMKQR